MAVEESVMLLYSPPTYGRVWKSLPVPILTEIIFAPVVHTLISWHV